MLHPLHRSFRLPGAFGALAEFLMEGLDPGDPDVWRYASWIDRGGDLFCGDIDPGLLGMPQAGDDPRALCGELAYSFQPLEILPFCWNGGDALHYGWAVLAPELDADDHPCVSFAPGDEHALWLGDNTKEALENLLVGAGQADDDPRQAEVCSALGLRPDFGSSQIRPGARSHRQLGPRTPPGWRFEPTLDGIGVLAPAEAFAPGTIRVDDPQDFEDHLPVARQFLTDGYPGSALCVLKSLAPYGREIVESMRDAYQLLGRALHVERAELWLQLHPAVEQY
jgi:hypothetical protein